MRIDGSKACKYKIIADKTSKLFKLNIKSKLDILVQVVDYMIAKFGLEEEFDEHLKPTEKLSLFFFSHEFTLFYLRIYWYEVRNILLVV